MILQKFIMKIMFINLLIYLSEVETVFSLVVCLACLFINISIVTWILQFVDESSFKNKMAACLKISRRGYFRKIFGQGGYTKNTPYPLFPMSGITLSLNTFSKYFSKKE